MKIFISYHRKDTKYRIKLEKILKENNIDYYAVPENADYDGMNHDTIRQTINRHMVAVDVVICIVGKETYTRPHVSHELNAALSGGVGKRKGVIALILENRMDPKDKIDWQTVDARISKNQKYVIIEKFGSFHSRVVSLIELAYQNSKDLRIQVKNNMTINNLRGKKYYG